MTSSPHRARALRHCTIVFVLGALALLGFATDASAETASMSWTDTTGRDDPTSGLSRTMTIKGNSPAPRRLYIRVRAPGGAPCANTADSDSGDYLEVDSSTIGPSSSDWDRNYYGTEVNGDFSFRDVGSWTGGTGTFMFCFWIADSPTTPVTAISQQITFRNRTGVISAALNPATPVANQDATVTFSGSSEGPATVYAKVRTAGAPCAATYSADPGDEVVDGVSVDGAYAVPGKIKVDHGTHVICMWLARSSTDATPLAGPQPLVFTIPAPPPPCVVPTVASGTPLASVTSSLAAAGCSLGRRKYAASSRFARGTVIRFDVSSGTQLSPGAAVGVLISSGAPCIVPNAKRGMKIATAKSRLARSGCRSGRVKYVKSRRKKGTIVRFAPRSGARLAPRSQVTIWVSSGRRR
jgi:hypothetical protein